MDGAQSWIPVAGDGRFHGRRVNELRVQHLPRTGVSLPRSPEIFAI